MAIPISEMFPLAKEITGDQLVSLCQTLWGWGEPCARCSELDRLWCPEESCPWSRLPRLEPFFQYYRDVTALYSPESILKDTTHCIRSHDDLLDIIKHLQRHITTRRSELTTLYFAGRDSTSFPPVDDQHRAINLAVRVMLMTTCSVDGQTDGLLELGTTPSVWRNDQSMADFIASTFLARDHPTLNDRDALYPDIRPVLKAPNLKKVARLNFVGTNDLRHHLMLDQNTGTVEIYHYTSVLRESLEVLKRRNQHTEAGLEGILPEQLLVETLDSIQRILFPVELESQAFLRSLISKQSFDPDCGRLPLASQETLQGNIRYRYWGSRLMDLYDEIENPKPRGVFYTWLEQKSKARHAMLAAIIGVFMAIVLGILALLLAIIQTYIAWQAWKHPISND